MGPSKFPPLVMRVTQPSEGHRISWSNRHDLLGNRFVEDGTGALKRALQIHEYNYGILPACWLCFWNFGNGAPQAWKGVNKAPGKPLDHLASFSDTCWIRYIVLLRCIEPGCACVERRQKLSQLICLISC